MRTLTLLILAVVGLLLLWPMEYLYALISKDESIIDELFAVSSSLSYANSLLNPMLYAFSHIEFKTYLINIVKRKRKFKLNPGGAVSDKSGIEPGNIVIIKC